MIPIPEKKESFSLNLNQKYDIINYNNNRYRNIIYLNGLYLREILTS